MIWRPVLCWTVDLLTAEADLNIILCQSLGCNPRRSFHMSVTKLIELMMLRVIIVWNQNIACGLNIELCGLNIEFCGLNIEFCGLNIKLCGLNIELSGLNIELCGLNIELCGLNIELCGLNIELCGLNIELCNVKRCAMQVIKSFMNKKLSDRRKCSEE